MFKITDHLEFDTKGRSSCPCCEEEKGKPNKNLSLVPNTDGAYKCFRGCTPEDIRAALGVEKTRQIPAATIKTRPVTCSPQQIAEDHAALLADGDVAIQARTWMENRGITMTMLWRHKLGLRRLRINNKMWWGISIPIPANPDKTQWFRKARIEPWNPESPMLWHQKGIPATVFFTQKTTKSTQTYLCEGEWDAMVMANEAWGTDIAVASFTCGCQTTPPDHELARLIGKVSIFYDRNDKPLKNGDRPGDEGAKKVAKALGDRASIKLVPGNEDQVTPVKGWDVSDAISAGYTLIDFQSAPSLQVAPKDKNPLRDMLFWNDELLDKAPDYTEWLVPDLLTQNELFLLAAGARTGKSLMSMTLAKAVATGTPFLGRPTTQGTVLYVAIEDAPGKLKEREMAQGWTRGMSVVWLQKFKLSDLAHLRQIAEEIDDLRLIILDTLSRIRDTSVSESSSEMSQVLEPLQDMANALDVCVILVHHTGKVSIENADSIDIFDTIRGSSAIRNVCRGSMVIAKADQKYRLVVENGWGKHDLKVVLDGNTLEWKLLGNWSPSQNLSQKEQILDVLQKTQVATIDQISEATGINKKCLYEQLSRLQIAEAAEDRVVKEGKRRNYTYRLALFNTIQQLNSVLNSPNPDEQSDKGSIQQNHLFSRDSQNPNTTVHSLADQNAHFENKGTPVEYRHPGGANPLPEGDSPIQQLFNSYSTVEYKSGESEESDQSTGTIPLISTDQWMRWTKIDTLVKVLSTKGGRCKVKVPGESRARWIPSNELTEVPR